MENLKKQELNRQSLQDMEYINKQQENRTNQYRDKINGNNEKIYHHAANFNHFIGGKPEPFHVNIFNIIIKHYNIIIINIII